MPLRESCSFTARDSWEIVKWKEGSHLSMRRRRSSSLKMRVLICSSESPKPKWKASPAGIRAVVTALINRAK